MRLVIAVVSSPVELQMYELCCDMIELLLGMSEIYGRPNGENPMRVDDEDDDEYLPDERDNQPDDEHSPHEWNLASQNDDYAENSVQMNGTQSSSYGNSNASLTDPPHSSLLETSNEPVSAVFDSMSSSVIKLSGGRALYLKEINRHLALICILREEALSKQALIDYNVRQLKKSITKLFRLNQQLSRSAASSSNLVE